MTGRAPAGPWQWWRGLTAHSICKSGNIWRPVAADEHADEGVCCQLRHVCVCAYVCCHLCVSVVEDKVSPSESGLEWTLGGDWIREWWHPARVFFQPCVEVWDSDDTSCWTRQGVFWESPCSESVLAVHQHSLESLCSSRSYFSSHCSSLLIPPSSPSLMCFCWKNTKEINSCGYRDRMLIRIKPRKLFMLTPLPKFLLMKFKCCY